MSLFKQIALLFGFFIAVTLAVVFYLNFKTANAFVQDQLYSDAQDTATSLGLAISMVAEDPEAMPRIDTMINAIFDSGYYQAIVLEDIDGTPLLEKHNPKKVKSVPQWFINAVPFKDAVGKSRIMVGWQQFGTVYVYNHKGHAYYQLWTTLVGLFVWSSVIVATLFLLLYSLLRMVFRPVAEVLRQADAILQNRFITTDDIPFTTELRGITRAMNTTVLRIKEIFEREAAAIRNYHDLLYTDQEFHIPNRTFLITTLQNNIGTHGPHAYGALAMVTIEHFEMLKSRFGYHECNTFVQELLEALAATPETERQKVVVARMNSSDFAVMVPGLHTQNSFDALGDALMQTAESVAQSHFGDEAGSAGIHMGIGAYEPEQSIDTTLSHVDHALMQAKMEAPFTSCTFRYDADAAEFQKHGKEDIVLLIRDALAHDRIRLASQRCMEMDTGATFHSELFARFQTADGEVIPARILLPVAHSAALLDEIDLYLLHKVCMTAPECAMNLSAQTLEKGRFLQKLEKLSNQKKISPLLHFETSLTIVNDHLEAVERFSEKLRAMHFAFGIDGFVFGSHEAELLKTIRPDYIKISTSYLCGFPGKKKQASMLRSLQNLTSSIGTRIIATNVENEEQVKQLLEFGITCMQGFYIHKPELLKQ